MTKDEALKLALKFVEDSECGTADLEAHIKEALAQPSTPYCGHEETTVKGSLVHCKKCDRCFGVD